MPAPSTTYEPRHPAQGPLYQIVHDHFETFRAHAASLRDGEGLPSFVEQAFRDFLRCGWLAGGFARLRCGDCGLDRLIPFPAGPKRCVHAAAAAGWLSAQPIWSIMCSQTHLSDSGS